MKNEQIRREVEQTYGSLEVPNFDFQSKVLCERPYREFVDELLTHFYLRDDTELNQDVCFSYSIEEGGALRWMVQLSMVTRCAVLLFITDRGPNLVEPSDLDKIHGGGEVIVKLLAKHNIPMVAREVLLEPIGLQLFNTDPANVRLYQALFSDTDIPWQAEISA